MSRPRTPQQPGAVSTDLNVQSSDLRQRGNSYYLQAADCHGDKKRRLLQLALSLYQKAADAIPASEEEDLGSTSQARVEALASAHKNIASTLKQLAYLAPAPGGLPTSNASSHRSSRASDDGDSDNDSRADVAVLLKAVKHWCIAFEKGIAADKGQAWVANIWDSLGATIEAISQTLAASVDIDPFYAATAVHQLDSMRTTVPTHMAGCVAVGLRIFLQEVSVTAADLIDVHAEEAQPGPGYESRASWSTCLSLLTEVNRAMVDALKLATQCDELENMQMLLELDDKFCDIRCCCESAQARLQGEEMLSRVLAIRQPESPNRSVNNRMARMNFNGALALQQDGAMAVVDKFKLAILINKAKNLDAARLAEAKAYSRLGHTYKVCANILDPVLQRDPLLSRSAEERSVSAYLQVLGLVETLPNKVALMTEPWYAEARGAIFAYQCSKEAEESRRKQQEEAPVREELKAELTALYAASNKGWMELLKHCYTAHPPLNPANRVTDFSGFTVEKGKDVLRKAIVAYHPDKQSGSSKRKWKLLAEEITKELTRKYEVFK